MDTVIATLACCFLALSLVLAQTGNMDPTVITPPAISGSHLTPVTTPRSTSNAAVDPTTAVKPTEGTTEYSSTGPGQVTLSSSTAETTEIPLTTPTSDTTSASTQTTLSTQSPPTTTVTAEASHTTVTDTGTTITPVTTTDNGSPNSSTASVEGGTKGLNISEKSMTIVFSVILGVFIVALVVFALYKYKHKIQYLHQPLNSADNTDAFVDDGDTLVISGGLYDGHPIYDNVPPPPSDRSQFRLDFLH